MSTEIEQLKTAYAKELNSRNQQIEQLKHQLEVTKQQLHEANSIAVACLKDEYALSNPIKQLLARVEDLKQQLEQAYDTHKDLQYRVDEFLKQNLKLQQQLEAANKACAFNSFTLQQILCTVVENENPHLFSLSAREVIFRILQGLDPLPPMCSEKNQGVSVEAGSQKDEVATLACSKGERSKEVSELREVASIEASREGEARLPEKGSLQDSLPNDTQKCCCVGEDEETQEVQRMRLDWNFARAPRRLQQAVERAVAVQYLSRQEAQKILAALSNDCDKDYAHKSKALTCFSCGDGATFLYCLNCARKDHFTREQVMPLVEALRLSSEVLCEVSKCCADLRDWDTIDADWVNAAHNRLVNSLTHARSIGLLKEGE